MLCASKQNIAPHLLHFSPLILGKSLFTKQFLEHKHQTSLNKHQDIFRVYCYRIRYTCDAVYTQDTITCDAVYTPDSVICRALKDSVQGIKRIWLVLTCASPDCWGRT